VEKHLTGYSNIRLKIKYIVQTLRPRQWVKSFFLLAPALFTLEVLNPAHWVHLLAGFFGFSLAASALYTLNDILDRVEDRQHPLKRRRPVAGGNLSVAEAGIIAATALAAGLWLLKFASPSAAVLAVGYAVLMLAYTLWLKRMMILDVIIIAMGFVLRVETGAVIVGERVSQWLLLCTFTIALFLGMIKRRQEIAVLSAGAGQTRKSLAEYPSVSIIDGWINVLAGMTVICYALYTVDPNTVQKHHTEALLLTLPFVLYGIFHYQKLALTGREGEDPAALITKDWGIKLVVALWVLVSGVILYLAKP